MRVIRDEHDTIGMLALCVNWGIRRCNQQDCTSRPTTIIGGAGVGIPVFGLCEEHYQMCNIPGGSTLCLDFDNFDAFAIETEAS